MTTRTELRPIPAQWKHLFKALQRKKVFHDYIGLAHTMAFWRTATAFTVMDVKASTKVAKQLATMTVAYHNLIYMVMYKLVVSKDSMISKNFAAKLAAAKSTSQLDDLVDEIAEIQLPSPIKKQWDIPQLQDLELEVLHLATYWTDVKKVSVIR